MTDDAFTLGLLVGLLAVTLGAFMIFMVVYLFYQSGEMHMRQRIEHLTPETPAEIMRRSRRATFLLWLILSFFGMVAYLYFASIQPTAATMIEQGMVRWLVRMLDILIPLLEAVRALLQTAV